MARVARLLVVCSVATIAFRGSAFIDVVLVAGTAVQCRVHTLEREDTAVAEIGLIPTAVAGFMAELTGRRKACRRMVRVCGLFIVPAMTAITILRCSGINAVFMTGRTLKRGVDTLAGKDAVMVEGSLIPAGVGRQMAELASRRKTRLGVVEFLRFLIILSVAGITVEGGLA
jgi:hypothetical protein